MGPFGEMAEWFKAAVLKTVVGKLTGGSNPSLSVVREQVLLADVFWRDGRVAECTSLLRTRLGNWTEGSNPSLSVLLSALLVPHKSAKLMRDLFSSIPNENFIPNPQKS